MDKESVVVLLKQKVEEAGGQFAWARLNDVSRVYVSDVLAGRRDPAGKILEALGLEKVPTYRKRES